MDLKSWVLQNLDNSYLTSIDQSDAPNFGIILWMLWKARANLIFQGQAVSLNGILTSAMRLQLDYHHCRAALRASTPESRRYIQILIGWSPPPSSWVKCNTDGSVCGQDMLAGCGGVCRDSNSRWLFGFARNIGTSNVLWFELWAIFTIVPMVWNRGYRRVIVESDSLVAVNLINSGCSPLHPYASLVNQIRGWLARDWGCPVCSHPS